MDNIEIIDLDSDAKKNKQKLPVGTILTFIILLLIIGAYFIYDIFFNKEEIIKDFSFKDEAITLNLNEVSSLEKNMDLNNLSIYDISFSIENTDIVFIDSYSLISGNEVGETILKATYDNTEKTIKVLVTSGINTDPKLTFTKHNIDLNKNFSRSIYDYLDVENIDRNDIEFSVSNSDVAEVVNGNIITKEDGKTTIKAIYGDLQAELNITVGEKYLYFNQTEITLAKDSELEIVDYLDYLGIDNLVIVYKVSDLSILYIDNNKIFTRSIEGQTEVTATYGDLSAKMIINVK